MLSVVALQAVTARLALLMDGDLMKVVGCMEHAIAAVYPRTRYSPGWDAKLIWLPLSYMPSFVTDSLVLKFSPKINVSMF